MNKEFSLCVRVEWP